jgi:hypothetical protein
LGNGETNKQEKDEVVGYNQEEKGKRIKEEEETIIQSFNRS